MNAIEGTKSADEIVSPFAEQILQHLLYQGNRNDCAAFTVATLIHAFTNQRVDPQQLAQEMNKPVWRGFRPPIRRQRNGRKGLPQRYPNPWRVWL